MKIGILTLLPSLNYGAILQCVALERMLEAGGHTVRIIDYRETPDTDLVGWVYRTWGWQRWAIFALRSILGLGDFQKWLRYRRTRRFLDRHLNMTPWKLCAWKDAPKDIDLDLIVVGSDQVWHCGDWGNPSAFLMEDAPGIPAIAYAASFGVPDIPERIATGAFTGDDIRGRYQEALRRFLAVSCRESEGAAICGRLGFSAAHVADPSLLPEIGSPVRKNGNLLVCYLLTYSVEELEAHIAKLEKFVAKTGFNVRVFIREYVSHGFRATHLPVKPQRIAAWLRHLKQNLSSRVRIEFGAGPAEFLAAMGEARWMVTDSFHGLMFAIRNNCDARVLRPTNPTSSEMFARIEEFAAHVSGPLLQDGVDAALASIERGESIEYDYAWLDAWRNASLAWLSKALHLLIPQRKKSETGAAGEH